MTGPSYIDIFDGHIALLSDDMSDMDLMKDQGQGKLALSDVEEATAGGMAVSRHLLCSRV